MQEIKNTEQVRNMATIRKIDSIAPIEGADRIEVATIGGWKVVVNKGLYTKGDLCVYCEIDSFIPSNVAPFLTKEGNEPKTYNGVKGERLRTARLKGQLSQGLVLPLYVLGEPEETFAVTYDSIGADVSLTLGIVKWEAPEEFQRADAKGNFPSFIPKTKQERLQNLSDLFEHYQKDHKWNVTEKVDGSSLTAYVYNDLSGVCSRNLELKEDDGTFWSTAKKYKLIEKIKLTGRNLAIQGEMHGAGINGNLYKLNDVRFICFDIFDIDNQTYLLPDEMQRICKDMQLDTDTIFITNAASIRGCSIEDLIVNADGKSAINPSSIREGYVYKSTTDTSARFKVISNSYLLKKG